MPGGQMTQTGRLRTNSEASNSVSSPPRRSGSGHRMRLKGGGDSPAADGCDFGRWSPRSSGGSADRGPARSAVGTPDQLANLDQVPIGVAHVTADLAATVDR